MQHSLCDLPEPNIETMIEMLDSMVKEKYGSKLGVIYIEGGNFEGYQKTIKVVESLPVEQRRAVVVRVCMEDADLLRYPLFDVEFNVKSGAKKIGVTGSPEKVQSLFRLIGGEKIPRH